MSPTAYLNIPAYEGVMEVASILKKPQIGALELRSLITPNLKIPSEDMDYQGFYMKIAPELKSNEAYSVTFYPQNATEEEQKNFPVLYAGLITKKDKDGTIQFKSQVGNFEGILRPQDILFDCQTGKLIDGATGEFDMSRQCLQRMYDFPTYAAKDNPPKRTFLLSETPIRGTPNETYFPTKAQVAAANFKSQHWIRGRG